MKRNISIALFSILILLIGIFIGRFTSPVKEVEKIVEVTSPSSDMTKKYLSKFIDIQ